ncbi:ClC family H(+)/Cl(-) exchange transporter [uncultured Clostridium sp.]|uniref:ClC family H(+)/Cl(-) exchange transporter n=1 Tax=uncultured Clostridium sp. TaxID=59620 RepID=UPI00260E3170|nr:ClC family H(+)/Cl(-) exchange transporter [uncultured Clostridium sp.]
MDSKISRMYDILSGIKLRIVLQSIVVGLIAGLLISIYRLVLDHIDKYTYGMYSFLRVHEWYILLAVLGLAIAGFIVGAMVQDESMISGSGIPQIEGILTGHFKEPSPVKIIIYKFVGGVIAIGSGLSLGIEGPSIQLGATIANLYGNVTKRLKLEKRFLISSGAGAGLSAAFNAPFAGVMFVLEEVHKKFTPTLFVSAIAASVSADIVTWAFFGQKPILDSHVLKAMPIEYYPYIIVLGIIVGLAGVFYNKVLVKTMGLYKKINIPVKYRMIIPFVITIFFGLFIPKVLGGGAHLINDVLVSGLVLKLAIILLVAKFIFSMISFCSGTPGGILFPLLTLGSLVGAIFGDVVIQYMGVNPIYATSFILFAMAAMFASIVRAPITGFMLVCEMSGSFTQFGSIALVCGVSYLTAEMLRCEPVYESLFKLRVSSQTGTPVSSENAEIIISYIIEMGSSIVGKKLREVKLVDHTLVISIEREGTHMIPDGNTILMAGDTISVMVTENKEIVLRERLEGLCVHCDT